ncbi:5-oxoprolinase subunit PxpB [Cytobacillus firmus]|uniref:Allophanate hydrolase subunit 1 n=1 Tax=Cytobacillus firmus DS1 TaxID=1307436 RepID=W7L3L9_CYTFI|nr:5-oxoprolinase subunit PxpB [Cytobacillus firmus]EWG10191.1 allophanate hydrolase subunit 1 [Cytobacillus firmus DS1]
MEYTVHPLGDNAVLIELGNEISEGAHQKVQTLTAFLEKHPPDWMIEYIPAYTTVTIFYNPFEIYQLSDGELPFDFICSLIKPLMEELGENKAMEARIVEIPVCYGGEFGPDLDYVAEHNGLTSDEVIDIHSSGSYLVYMIGFAPGFPFIGGMSEQIAAPRRDTPRLKIPERTVGIAGMQTGIYPIETPGGWQLIGRTPVKLFRPMDESPTLLTAGDKIKFKPISLEEYHYWEETDQ